MKGLFEENPWPKLLKQLRLVYSYTQGQAAHLVGVDQTTWSRWERGKTIPEVDIQRMVRDLLNRRDPSLTHQYIERLGNLTAVVYRHDLCKLHYWSWKAAEAYRIRPQDVRDTDMRHMFPQAMQELYEQIMADPAWKTGNAAIYESMIFRPNGKWVKATGAPIAGSPYVMWSGIEVDDITCARLLHHEYKIITFDEIVD